MGFYARRIFPWCVDRGMSREPFVSQRREVVAGARGHVLEIGFGTGLNLPFYPRQIESLVAIDANFAMIDKARPRLVAAPFRAAGEVRDVTRMPFGDDSFDTVVCTWTLCSVGDVPAALAEVHRVLRPGGALLFVEHGLSPDRGIAKWQRRLTPVQKWWADGCHLDRDVERLIAGSPLSIERCEKFYLPKFPRVGAYTYRGVARKG